MTGPSSRVIAWMALAALLALATVSPQAQSSPSANSAGIQFADVTAAAKIAFVHASGATPEKHMVETFGSGVAWIDYDNDDYADLFFVNGAPGSANALYHNNRDGTFTDVTQKAGVAGSGSKTYKTGAAVGDYDHDGDLDLYVTAFGPNTLYRNNGDGTFTDATAAAGVAGPTTEWSTSAGFFDFDRDGNLDLYVVNYLDIRPNENPYCGLRKPGYRMYCHPTMFDGMADRLFKNAGNGTFTDVSAKAGIANPAGKGLGVAFCDFDRDGDTDVYVANDTVRNFLYRNDGNAFVDVAYNAGVGFDINGKPQAGMGVDCADVDANGFPDIFVTNFSEELNSMYMNRGDGIFEDLSSQPGLGAGFVALGFGAKLFDADNDGDLDIHVTNGHVIDNVELYQSNLSYAQKDLLFENTGGSFKDATPQAGPALQATRVGRGLAVADFDNDGRLDVAISSLGRRAVLLRNTTTRAGNWIILRAQGGKSNRGGLGATVRVRTGTVTQVREFTSGASYLSANDVRLHIGVGAAKTIDRIEILWPNGAKQALENVAVNQVLIVKEPS